MRRPGPRHRWGGTTAAPPGPLSAGPAGRARSNRATLTTGPSGSHHTELAPL
ncbi:hypothetical protein ACFFX0_28905 [Citricoccus parietis]|uniref:Uncharacterized protein n=1 Tax=Citricoccus parietis TaxID=592307 RepID=A0ABV5G7R1_9MICC